VSAEKTTITPIPYLAAILGAAGGAKLVGLKPLKANFAHWGYGHWTRRGVGAVELGIAAAAVRGLQDPILRKAAGGGTLLLMAGALRTHGRAGDAKANFIPPVLVALLGVATYFDTTLVLEP
jgi:hypothetical protein